MPMTNTKKIVREAVKLIYKQISKEKSMMQNNTLKTENHKARTGYIKVYKRRMNNIEKMAAKPV